MFGLLSLATPSSLFAQDQPKPTLEPTTPPTIRIGVEAITHLPYYGMCGKEFCGYGRDLMDAFAADLGVVPEYRSLPIPRLHRTLVEGGLDLKFPANPIWGLTLKGDVDITYSVAVAAFIDGFVTMESLQGLPKSVGTMRGFTLDLSVLGDNQPYVMEANAEENLYSLLTRGRVEAVYTNIGVMWDFIRREQLPGDQIVFRRDMPFSKSEYMVSSAKRPDLIARFNLWFQANTDMIEQLKRRYRIDEVTDTVRTITPAPSSQQP